MVIGVVEFLLAGFTDNSGNPLASGKVYTYKAGTTTNKATYTDSAGATPETNPVILDSNGRKQIYASGSYKFVIKTSADVTLYTLDNLFFETNLATTIAEISALNSAGLEIVIKSAITMTGNLTLTAPLRFLPGGSLITSGYTLTINGPLTAGAHQIFTSAAGEVVLSYKATAVVLAEWWGAVADDSTNCTSALNQALASTRATVQLLTGTYRHTGLYIYQSLTFKGTGWASILKNTSSVDHSISVIGNGTTILEQLKIQDMALSHTGSGSTVMGVYMNGVSNLWRLERLSIVGARASGIKVLAPLATSQDSLHAIIDQCFVSGSGLHGLWIEGDGNNISVFGGKYNANTSHGFHFDNTTTSTPNSFPNTIRCYSCDLSANAYGLYEGGHSNAYFGLRFESNVSGDIILATKSQSAMFFGTSYSSFPALITGTPTAAPNFYDKFHPMRFYNADGYLAYYDELLATTRLAPKRSFIEVVIPAMTASTGATDIPIMTVMDTMEIKSVKMLVGSAITGANTNYMEFQLRVKKTGGAGDIAQAFHTAFTSGVNLAALTNLDLTLGSSVNLKRVAGDILYVQKYEYGTGMASPRMVIQVEYGGY